MQAVVQKRNITSSGENVAIFDTGRILVRLVGTFGEQMKLDDLLYSIVCQRIADRLDNATTPLFENAAMV